MKKFISMLFLLALTTGCVFAQNFTLTPDGFVSSEDASKSYIVIESEGTQAELYKKVKNYLMKIYRSPKDVLSESEPDAITINGIEQDAVQRKAMGMVAVSYDMNYTIGIMFKDGRIRVDSPSFSLSSYNGDKAVKMYLSGKSNGGLGSEVVNTIYNTKGDLKAKYAKEQLEAFFNSYIKDLKDGLVDNKDDNW